jgi:murein DD-endopeptidase MepM/ murein hydrolase activator NlpD
LPLVIGDRLEPLPAGILCHRTGANETVRDIAIFYGVNSASILAEAWNALYDEYAPLAEGRFVRIPHIARFEPEDGAPPDGDSPFLAWMLTQPTSITPQEALGQGDAQTVIRRAPTTAPVPADWRYGSGVFMWPAYGWLTQGYRSDHRALDIAAPVGSPITASDRGVVLRAGWNNQGYGNFVIIDHNIDYLTLYAHLDHIFVQEGEVVAQGQILGTVGSTGNSTGPHLHFEIRDFGRLVNPLEFLGQ